MDDFLYNLRKSVEERSKSGGRHADGNTNRGGDRRCGMDRRNRKPQKYHNDRRSYPPYNRNLQDIKALLEKLTAAQDRQQALAEKRLDLEARRTVALERIAEALSGAVALPATGEDPPDATPVAAAAAPDAIEPAHTAVENQENESPEPATAGELMTTLRAAGKSYDKIAKALEAAGFPTVSGRGRWRGQTVKRGLAQLGVTG